MAKAIKYAEVCKDFRVEGNQLFRLLKGGSWKEVVIKASYSGGYCNVSWNGEKYRSHRIMWCLYHECDVDVKLKIDHKDGDKLNNSKENLILGTKRENDQNKQIHRNGKLVGCYFEKSSGKWQAKIVIDKKQITLGRFPTELEAHQCYMKACSLVEEYIDNDQFRKLLK